MERQNLINDCIGRLTFLKSRVEVYSRINLTDINIHSENFYRDFLNLLCNYNLENLNDQQHNATSIDLGDLNNKIAIQVTSTPSLSKTKKTVQLFIKSKLYEQYDRLVMLNIVKKSSHQQRFIGEEGIFQLDTKHDVWDISDIVKTITDLPLPNLESICTFLKDEIKYSERQALTKEIQTFVSLISYLSDESHTSAGEGYIEAPDPDRKINKRFSDYSEFLTTQYQNLYVEYGDVLKDVTEYADIGHAKIRRLGLHLKDISNQILTDADGDAKKALDKLVEHYGKSLSDNNVIYDKTAVRFFMVDQIIRCNVFPNKVNDDE